MSTNLDETSTFAFPGYSLTDNKLVGRHSGMTLRDWFAGQALCGLIAGAQLPETAQGFAVRAYKLADAMIAARDSIT